MSETQAAAPIFDIIPHSAEVAEPIVIGAVISGRHVEIGEDFLSRARGMISHVPSKIINYAVKRAAASWDSDDETIKLEFEGGRRLTITMETKAP